MGGLVLGAVGLVQEPLFMGMLPTSVHGSGCTIAVFFWASSLLAAQADIQIDGLTLGWGRAEFTTFA